MEYPYMRKSYSNKNKSTLRHIIGLTFIIFMFTLWIVPVTLMIYGSNLIRILTVILYLYQITFIQKWEMYTKLVSYFRIHEYYKSYTLIIEEEIRSEKVLLCTHPHGIISLSMANALNLHDSPLKNFIICGTRFVRYLPLSGIFVRWAGIEGVDHQHFQDFMNKGKNILFVPGGFECATLTNHRKDRVFIKNRKGFIKYSLRYGYKIYPCYNFNENKLFYTFNGLESVMFYLNKIKMPGCFFFGKFLFFPRNDLDLCTVIGKPLELPVIQNPSKEDVNKYHKMYIDSLLSLYNRYKGEFNCCETLELL